MKRGLKVLLLSGVCVAPGCGTRASTIDDFVLARDWSRVATSADEGRPGVLNAHAHIALNRNNEALCRFASLTDADRQAWDRWTEAFVHAHDGSAVAHYLRGDALARRAKWRDAIVEFDRALTLDPGDALAFNARGTVRSIQGDVERALADFVRATDVDGTFVDALASRGFAQLQSRTAPEGALDAFEAALRRAPEFAGAAAGRAYAEMALAQWDAGNRDFAAATRALPCAASVIGDTIVRLTAWAGARSGTDSEDTGVPPGTIIDINLKKLVDGDVGALKPIVRQLGENPEFGRKVESTLKALQQQKPDVYRRVQEQITSSADWTKSGGGAEKLLNGLKVGGSVSVKGPIQFEYDANRLVNQQLKQTGADHKAWSQLQKATKTASPPGGVNTSLHDALVDRGDWPFTPIYTLQYPTKEAR